MPEHPVASSLSPKPDFQTEQGRLLLYQSWMHARGDDAIQTSKRSLRERSTLFAEWIRYLVAHNDLNPKQRLPPYKHLATLPFNLKEKQIALVILQLRDEKVLPPRKIRKDAALPQWTERDTYCWDYIGHMRAIRFDQAQRLLARESPSEKAGDILSPSRASEIISRWTDPPAKFAIYKQIFHAEPGWIYLTRRGLREVQLDFRAEAPSSRTLEHLYWINEVRLALEDEYETDEMEWTSERTIQAEQDLRQRGQKLKHIPDGILTLKTKEKTETIDIEVQVSKPSPGEVEEVMGDYWHSESFNPLRYYVGKRSRGVVRTVHRRMEKELRAMRPRIEIIDLADLHAGEEPDEDDV